jgi:hypothetical protein
MIDMRKVSNLLGPIVLVLGCLSFVELSQSEKLEGHARTCNEVEASLLAFMAGLLGSVLTDLRTRGEDPAYLHNLREIRGFNFGLTVVLALLTPLMIIGDQAGWATSLAFLAGMMLPHAINLEVQSKTPAQ